MKYNLFSLILFLTPLFSLAGDPGVGVGPGEDGGNSGDPGVGVGPTVPIDQYDYSLIIAAILIISISAIFIMRKKLNKA